MSDFLHFNLVFRTELHPSPTLKTTNYRSDNETMQILTTPVVPTHFQVFIFHPGLQRTQINYPKTHV